MPSRVSFPLHSSDCNFYCNHLTENTCTLQTLLLTFFRVQSLLEFFGAGDGAVLWSRVRVKTMIFIFQGCSSPLAYSYCCISVDSGANKGDNHGTGSLVTEGHHRCFDWLSTRLEGFFHGEYKVACQRESCFGACSLSKCKEVFE